MGRSVALINGVTGQDGSYLPGLLLSKGYDVRGVKRRTSLFNTDRIDHFCRDMVRADYQLARRDALATLADFKVLEHHE